MESSEGDVAAVERGLAAGDNPRDWKRALARALVAEYHGEESARVAEEHFDRLFVRHDPPAEIPDVTVTPEGDAAPLTWVLRAAGLVSSTSEGRRLVEQGGVSVDGERVTDLDRALSVGSAVVIQVGKRRFARVKLGRPPSAPKPPR
jgi:tyrosyl-tRNA synthetase